MEELRKLDNTVSDLPQVRDNGKRTSSIQTNLEKDFKMMKEVLYSTKEELRKLKVTTSETSH